MCIRDRYKKLVKNAQEKLVVAGGYEERIPENREHYLELKQEAERLGVSDSVIFLRSVSDGVRVYLLNHAIGVLYTPENEHFGIVPVEAMYMQRPVIACQSGGPLESVVDGKTGFSLPTDEKRWAESMKSLTEGTRAKEMGKEGKSHVVRKFGLESFARMIDLYVNLASQGERNKKTE
eukprot:TRINITY_DN2053_c0_g1_i3.p1 TRINITY_DN2053_c0_g1~~TRINITY_DN2053_c0_g1_i3.p1  ORF type:complete len:198 (+),score=68.70 TRINITY_DN2053_c0_g1_i3:61-594(+)